GAPPLDLRHAAAGVMAAAAAAAAAAWLLQASLPVIALSGLFLPWVAAGLVLARAGWRRDDGRLLVSGLVLAVLGTWLVVAPALPAGGQGLAVPSVAAALTLGTAGWLLLLRFVQTLNAVELLNIDLEALVQARTAELQSQFERVRELERRQAIADERERLMRDMHDGVGGHLVSVLAMIENDRRRPGELAEVVRQALDDMRLLVDSLEPEDDDLNAVLAMWHDRLAPRLRVAGVVLHWQVDLLPPVPGLSPARVLHVLRILQEGVSNALRHGQARTLTLGAVAADGGVRIALQDDGLGFDAGASFSGRGLKNMRRRAQEVGATLGIESAAGQGALITLWLPLQA
ncbi:MAG: histidine kinase, partial [Rubrivivax sp.]|nr:histidine kinase [Rubrivivax sp.]